MPDESIYLNGQLNPKAKLSGNLSQPLISLSGSLSNPNVLSGTLSDDLAILNGQLSSDNKLSGRLSSPLHILSGMLSKPEILSGKLSNATLRGYSAYEIAVIYGYEGTEEEWIASLHGDKMEIRNNDGIIEYKYETQSLWTVLIDLNKYTNDYEKLINKPKIDGTTLIGDRDLSIDYLRNDRALTNFEIEELLT